MQLLMVIPFRHPKLSRVRGFSLIELLVTLAVVAILSSLLFPTLGKVHGMALILMCQNNMRVFGMALDDYREENGRNLPPSRNQNNPQELMALSAGTSDGVRRWDGLGLLWAKPKRYIGKDSRVFFCPSHQAEHRFDTYATVFTNAGLNGVSENVIYGNYHYWGAWTDRVGEATKLNNANRRAIDLGKEIVLTDGMRTKRDVNHVGGCNGLFSDGHISWLGSHDLSKLLSTLPSKPEPRDVQLQIFGSIVGAMGAASAAR